MYCREIRKLQEYNKKCYPELSTYETLQIAIEVQGNEILSARSVVRNTEGDSTPMTLERVIKNCGHE